MIQWRTSRFLVMFFVVQLAMVGIFITVMIEERGLLFRQESAALARNTIKPAETIINLKNHDLGRPIMRPRYPVIEVRSRPVSIFDPDW